MLGINICLLVGLSANLVACEGLLKDPIAAVASLSASSQIASPIVLRAVPLNGSVYLKWSFASPPSQIASYTVLRGNSPDSEVQIGSGITTAQYFDKSVVNGATYYYRILGVSSSGAVIGSTEASASPAGSLCNSDSGPSTFGAGSGTSGDPYLICSVDHLNNIKNRLNSNSFYLLSVDIDLSGQSFTPIGTSQSSPFIGTFDGGGFTISNWTYSGSSDIALFGDAASAVFKNLRLENFSLTKLSQRGYLGTLVGFGQHVNVSNVQVIKTQLSTSLDNYVGGIISACNGSCSLSNSFSTGQIGRGAVSPSGTLKIGGLIGGETGTSSIEISSSYSLVDIQAPTSTTMTSHRLGGLLGWMYSCDRLSISNSYTLGQILISVLSGTGIHSGLGGLVGSGCSSGDTGSSTVNNFFGGALAINTPSKTGPLFGSVGSFSGASGNFFDSTQLSGLIAAWPSPAPSSYGSGLPTATLQNGAAYSGWDTQIWIFAANSYPLLKNVPGISQPTQLVAVSATGSVALSWSAPVQNLSGGWVSYSIYRGTEPGSETLIKSGVTDTSWVDSATTNPSSPPLGGTLYYYRVRAEGNGIPSGLSSNLSVTPL